MCLKKNSSSFSSRPFFCLLLVALLLLAGPLIFTFQWISLTLPLLLLLMLVSLPTPVQLEVVDIDSTCDYARSYQSNSICSSQMACPRRFCSSNGELYAGRYLKSCPHSQRVSEDKFKPLFVRLKLLLCKYLQDIGAGAAGRELAIAVLTIASCRHLQTRPMNKPHDQTERAREREHDAYLHTSTPADIPQSGLPPLACTLRQ